jgi:2-keto-4-pentenoate hydratase/2-oxohepta-3-ene-1,7-dioic acid hydratase in catechol pathway
MTLWCIGRNYREHAKELNNPIPAKPLIFIKPEGALTRDSQIRLPTAMGAIHFECELAIQLGPDLKPSSLALALDLTARSVQDELKKKGEPWALAKGFIGSCPLSAEIPFPADFAHLQFEFYKNSQLVQKGAVSEMIFSLPVLLEYLIQHFPLLPGDWILTGTPAGVGPLASGDALKAQIPGRLEASWVVHDSVSN